MRSHRVQGWLSEAQRLDVERSYQAFLETCAQLDLEFQRREPIQALPP